MTDDIDHDHQASVAAYKAAWERAEAGQDMPPESGNVWFPELKIESSTTWDAIAYYCTLAITVIATVALIAGASGYFYQRFFN